MASPKGLYSNFPSSPSPMPAPKKAAPAADDGQGGQGDIENDPQAMKCIADLVQAGYTPDEVSQAMEDFAGSDDQGADDGSGGQGDDGSQSSQSAPLQIPGMQ
jgi:hypothetical protein